jgi:hypothetical protein
MLCLALPRAVSAQTTAVVCSETRKVGEALLKEAIETKATLDVARQMNVFLRFFTDVGEAVEGGYLMPGFGSRFASYHETLGFWQYQANELGFDATDDDAAFADRFKRMTQKEKVDFQARFHASMKQLLKLAFEADDNAELEYKLERVTQQLELRKKRLADLHCGDVMKRAPALAGGQDWTGSWTREDGIEVVNVSGSGGGVTASLHYEGAGFSGNGNWSNCRSEGATLVCDWRAQHDDATKSGTRKGTITLTLNGDTMGSVLVEDTPEWSWKPGYSPANVTSVHQKGKTWTWSYSRK